jgi:multicomponent Na+:H+ antiporter subunit D
MLFALVASGLWIVASLYSIGYMRANGEAHQTRFFAFFALSISATLGVAFAANLLTLFIFYELLTLATYPLVTHHGDEEARRGGRVYLGMLLATSTLFLFPAIVATWVMAGSVEFVDGGILGEHVTGAAAAVLLALYAFGIGKAALMPFHRWLPAAMVAPTPVSALLHAVAVVKAGVFSIVKVAVYVFGIGSAPQTFEWLIWVSGFTIVAASVVALGADNLKRRLAYSTVSQLSYVVMATALLVPASVAGAALHVAAHAFGKITLFFAAGAIYTAAHRTQVSQLDGIGWRMPWTMTAFGIASLSMIGLPPTAGMVSKWYIVTGALQAGHWPALAVLAAGTLLSAAYLLPIVHRAFLRPPPPGAPLHGEAPWPMVVALCASAALTVAMFFAGDLPLALAGALATR